jgi:hypothetical protein
MESLLKEHRPSVTAPRPAALTKTQQQMLARAKKLLAKVPNLTPDGSIIVAIVVAELSGDQQTLGMYDPGTNTIYLSPAVFDLGTKQVVSTLFEELIHATTGKHDCTYDMQTYLFNLIISLYEEHVFGEPC